MTQHLDSYAVPEELPIIPLRGLVVFPHMVLPIYVTRERSIAAIDDAMAGDRLVLLVAQREGDVEEPEPDDLHTVGTIATVMRILRMSDGRVKVLVQGLAKARIESFLEHERSRWVRVSELPADGESSWSVETEALMRAVRGHVEELLPLRNLPPEVISVTANVHDAGRLADAVASHLRLRSSEAQDLLEIVDPLVRLRRIDAVLRRELDVTSMQAEIQSQAREEMDRGQREHYLREQLRAIQAELGETDPHAEEITEYRSKIEQAGFSDDALAESTKQLRRLERMHPDGPEAHVLRSYLDWMVELPWSQQSPDRIDLVAAKQILDEDHAHLLKIKDRVLEHLGVRKLRGDARGSILCFAGPPGVGKTSLGRSIARAMGREFVRISLGGIRDEAEIRGHRRTYVGAMPGRILQGLKRAGTSNPVFMLDEIDKLGADFRGDPSAALLEVLDPEQNVHFSDHYLSVPFDLSHVMFIATANTIENVPPPLRDRMEVIRVPGYTPEEKLEITRSYLVPRQVREHGLPDERIRWSDAALMQVVMDYTREAGVRGLERKVAEICRKSARRAAEGDTSRVSVTCRSVQKHLGPPIYSEEALAQTGEIGMANGLAWTDCGGEILTIEASLTRGKGLVLTGQLGDVMKESGHTALTWARSNGIALGFDPAIFSRHEVHVHVPAGAIPKDGPSAGVAIATAMVSLATRRSVRAEVAMTGEVTLRGRVLPIGGVREKVLAAMRSGIKRVILPKKNLRDLQELSSEQKRRVTFIPVEQMEEVIEAALEPVSAPRAARSRPPRRVPRATRSVIVKPR